MIATASFGLRRSGTFCDGNIGSGLLGRISEAWPALAPPGECSLSPSSKSRTYTGPRTLGSPPPCREGLVVGGRELWFQLVHTPIALNILACMIILASFHP